MDATDYERKYAASPLFPLKNASTITAGSYYAYDWEVSNAASVKYLPFNFLQVQNNNSTYAVELYVNGDINPIDVIPAGVIRSYDKNTLPAFRAVLVKNIGSGTIAANAINLLAQRTAVNADDVTQTVVGRIIGGKKSGLYV